MFKEFGEIWGGFKRVNALLETSEKRSLMIATFLMLLTGILTNVPAVILGSLVDKLVGVGKVDFSAAIPFLALIAIAVIVKEILTVVRKYLVENTATITEKKQTVAVIEHLLKTDITDFINKYKIGSLHGKIFRSIQGLIRLIKLAFLDFFPAFFSALSAIAIAFYQRPFIASLMILVIPVGFYIILKQISSQKGIRVSLLRGKEEIDGAVVEMMSGIETIRVANTTLKEVKKVESIAEKLRKIEITHHIWMALYDAAKYLNEAFFYILVISTAIYFASIGTITTGDMLVYSILFMSVIGPLREIHRILDEAHESSIKVNDLYELRSQPLDESFKAKMSAGGKMEKAILNVKNVSFNYRGKMENVLRGVSFSLRKGEKIGIAGASGCGKSTLVKILLRLLHNYAGEIEFLGKDLKKLTREEIAEKIAYIPQKTYVFSGTIRENIIYGCEREIKEDEIIDAAKKANILQEIRNSLGGLSSQVAEAGNNLSGGQKQRIALARLILKKPEIIIFDEATSALDNTNEIIIQKNIEKAFEDATIITIAHRLTTLKNSDRILVFEEGKIVQEGTFEKLAKEKGLFKRFLEQKEPELT